jgi:splicing factor 3A subunit 3
MERIREAHEIVEAAQDAVCAELDEKPNGQKAKVQQQHAVSHLIDEILAKNVELQELYADKDGLLREELSAASGPNSFDSFYEALNATREYHAKFPDAPSSSSSSSSLSILSNARAAAQVPYSGEEVFGKYLDLHSFFVEYCNLPNMPLGSNQD